MANEYFVNQDDLTVVADAIRTKTKTSEKLVFPTEFEEKILAFENNYSVFKKIGTMSVGYTKTTLDIKSFSDWQNITVNDIYFVPINFSVTTTGQITGGTYKINKTYLDGIITAWRDSVPGAVGIAFDCEIYVYKSVTEFGKIYKVGENQPLTYGDGISINISSIVENYKSLSANNFYLDLRKIDVNVTKIGGGEANIIKGYDASTGVFTFSRASISFSGSMNNYCDVYVYVPYGS